MITFLDGPAHGVTLDLRRAPMFLRVVRKANLFTHNVDGIAVDPLCDACGERHEGSCEDDDSPFVWDALDQLEDAPRPDEEIFCYQLAAAPMTGFIDYRTGPNGGARRGHMFIEATYRQVPEPATDAVMRSNGCWKRWTLEAMRDAWDTLPQDLRDYFTNKLRALAAGEVNRG